MIQIDGSLGEGGGQILRSGLTLSIITQQPFKISNIRANRKKPGLKPQHLKCVEAAAAISNAEISNTGIGLQTLTFKPNELAPGDYRFSIGTAGSTSLVLQTIYLPLALANQISRVVIMGGTHVPWSPVHHYLTFQWLIYLKKIGFNVHLKFVRAGFFPKGDGKIVAEISPPNQFSPLELMERGELIKIIGLSAVANLNINIAQRQKNQIEKRLKNSDYRFRIKVDEMRSKWKNTIVLLFAEFENGSGCFTSLGAINKRAERVADEAVNQLIEFLNSYGCIDKYLADQLILPLAIIQQKSIIHTAQVTKHLLTNIEVVKKFLDVKIKVEGELGEEGVVEIG